MLGAITIGKHALIGANAVVTKDVAPGGVVAGIPAKPFNDRNPSAAKINDVMAVAELIVEDAWQRIAEAEPDYTI
jgi:serine acetyltransferase